jgi:hypothetical protein
MRLIYAVIFIFYICNVRSQSTSELYTDGTPITFTEDKFDVSASTASVERDIITSAGTASPITYEATSQQTLVSFSSTLSNTITTPVSQTTSNESSSGLPSIDSTDGTSSTYDTTNNGSTFPTITDVTPCPPGKFPFAKECIDAATNGGVVITAFILSIISFIGIIVSIQFF